VTAAWATAVVAVASFLLGVVLPFLYKRLSHEGYSVREVPWGAFGAIAVKVGDEDIQHGVFGVIKAANGSADPILIEDLRLGQLVLVFENANNSNSRQSLYLLDVDRNRQIVFPPVATELYRWATLPLILEPQTERELALWLSVTFDDDDTEHQPVTDPKPVDLVWKISGKSRKLKVTPRTPPLSLSMVVGTVEHRGQVIPVQLCPPGVSPSSLPPGAALGLRAGTTVNGLDLRGVDLTEARLDRSTLNGVRLDRAQMAGADLRASTLNSVSLSDADLSDARLDGSTLNDVRLDRAEMAGANLRAAELNSVSLTAADLSRVCLAGATLNEARLDGAQMVAANLAGLVGRMVNMADVNAPGASLIRAQLPNADLRRIDLRRADLRWVNLRGASLVDADLSRAKLHGADLSAADLSGAALPASSHDRVHHDIHTRWPKGYELPEN
jgi:uncharacterized protein YjbI with pentapeptide repeats